MKILIIIDSLGSGGAERSTAVLVDYLFEQNIKFEILCLDKKEIGVQKDLQDKGYKINFIKAANFYNQVREIAHFIKTNNFSLVHSILFRSNLRTRIARVFVDFKHVESLVNTTYSKERFNDHRVNANLLKIYKKIDKITAKKFVTHFHSITETVKDHYVKELNLDQNKVTVIYRGRKPILSSFEIEKNHLSNPFQIINVGRHEFQKGQIFLIQAARKLKLLGYNFKVDIYGREGSTSLELQNYIEKNELSETVSLKGFDNNVTEKLLYANLFVFPSLYEGLGGALIEAQAAGLPIACNNIKVLHEVVDENYNAKFFNVHDLDSVVQAIQYFMANPGKCLEFGERSLDNFNKKFLESENNKKMLNLYKEICLNSGK